MVYVWYALLFLAGMAQLVFVYQAIILFQVHVANVR